MRERESYIKVKYLYYSSTTSNLPLLPLLYFSFAFTQVNLVMDTLGALALGTESPTESVLLRKPYKRSASLISRPMWRNILCQSAFQLTLLFVLLFHGAEMFGVRPLSETHCFTYFAENNGQRWNTQTYTKSSTGNIGCGDFSTYCPDKDDLCYTQLHYDSVAANSFIFKDLPGFKDTCLTCDKTDYTHGTIIFNAFIFCQVRVRVRGTI